MVPTKMIHGEDTIGTYFLKGQCHEIVELHFGSRVNCVYTIYCTIQYVDKDRLNAVSCENDV